MAAPRPAPPSDSAATQLATIADHVDDYRSRVSDLAEPFEGTEREDLAIAMREAERQLRSAVRTLQRAARSASQ
ncbi:MAG: hypothetical protein AAGA42_10305 [Actinomycetota bacterium]